MKKMILLAGAVTLLMSCGGKNSAAGEQGAGHETTASPTGGSQADQADGAEADLFTEEAVRQQVSQMYERLNEMALDGEADFDQMDEEFCTSHYLSLKHLIAAHEGEGAWPFMSEADGFRWTGGAAVPVQIDLIEPQLLADGEARAMVSFKPAPDVDDDDDENWLGMWLQLQVENDRWRVANFDQPEAYGPGGFLESMENYVRENNIKQ